MYLIWFGDQSNDENETSVGGSLGEVALRSGGEILQVTEESLGNGEIGLVNKTFRDLKSHTHTHNVPFTNNTFSSIAGNTLPTK